MIDKTKYIGKYYGWAKIKDIISSEGTLNVVFEDEKEDDLVISLKQLDSLITDEAIEPTKFREIVCDPITKELLTVILNSGVRLEWVEYIFQSTAQSINHSLEMAEEKLWKKKAYNRTVLDVQNILIQK